MHALLRAALGSVLLLTVAAPAGAEDDFRITRYATTAGARSTGGVYALTGSVGQHDAGTAAGSRYAIYSGFWTPTKGDRLFEDDFDP